MIQFQIKSVRGTVRLVALLATLPLVLSACGSVGDSEQATDTAATEVSTPSDTPEAPPTATPEQVASVIAGKETDWREVIDGAGDCRFSWTLGGNDPVEKLNGMSCYMQETTISYTAQTAIESLAELNVPESMSALVDETNVALQGVVDVDLEAVCGEATKGPKDSKACSTALGQRMWAYSSLEDALDQWRPYL